MEKKSETPKNKQDDRFSNTDRDEATLGVSGNRKNDPGLSNEDQPPYSPPESQPEPRPPNPYLNSDTNPNSPA